MDKLFFQTNREAFISQMADDSLLVLFAGVAKHRSADTAYTFTPNRNFYYMTGLARQDMVLLIYKYHGSTDTHLFITKPNPDIEKWTGIMLKPEEANAISGIEKIHFTDGFADYFHSLISRNYFANVYLDLHYRPQGYLSKGLDFAHEIKEKYPNLAILSAEGILHDMRTIKKPEEIEKIREAIAITKTGVENIMTNCRPGLRESQLDAHFGFAILYNGANDRSFNTIAASGKNAVILHYEENKDILRDNTMVLLDLGCEAEYYCSDITRTIPVNGTFTKRQREVYESVLRVNEAVIKMIKPGLKFKEFLGNAKEMLAEECIKLGLITDKKEVDKYYYHGVGHYLGLDVHDVGTTDMGERTMEAGMVVTVEPGLYIAEEAIGVRIEDDVLVTETGSENLSQAIIKKPDEIEAFMKK